MRVSFCSHQVSPSRSLHSKIDASFNLRPTSDPITEKAWNSLLPAEAAAMGEKATAMRATEARMDLKEGISKFEDGEES